MAESHASNVTEIKTTFAKPDIVAEAQLHLSPEQCADLLQVLQSYPELFSGKLGTYPHCEFHLTLKPGAVPYHCKRPYPVPLTTQPNPQS